MALNQHAGESAALIWSGDIGPLPLEAADAGRAGSLRIKQTKRKLCHFIHWNQLFMERHTQPDPDRGIRDLYPSDDILRDSWESSAAAAHIHTTGPIEVEFLWSEQMSLQYSGWPLWHLGGIYINFKWAKLLKILL